MQWRGALGCEQGPVAGFRLPRWRQADYRYVECATQNLDVIAARFRTRAAYPFEEPELYAPELPVCYAP
jgi:hypothetical protein